jgi:hypothetical protein
MTVVDAIMLALVEDKIDSLEEAVEIFSVLEFFVENSPGLVAPAVVVVDWVIVLVDDEAESPTGPTITV